MGATIQCADCGTETLQRHPLSTRCRQCHNRHRRPHRRRNYSEKHGNRATWKRKSKRVRAEVGACEFCGSMDNLTTDHIIPRCDGGTSARHNLRVLCDDCHQEVTRQYNRMRARQLTGLL